MDPLAEGENIRPPSAISAAGHARYRVRASRLRQSKTGFGGELGWYRESLQASRPVMG